MGFAVSHIGHLAAVLSVLFTRPTPDLTLREEARSLLNSPFFKRWEPAVLDAYVEHGMYSTSSGSVRLKTTGVQVCSMLLCFLFPLLLSFRSVVLIGASSWISF